MDSHVVRRRINTISGHLATTILTEDVTATTTHLFPLNCSSNLITPIRRFDNRMQFGRQASSAQGYFMRQSMPSLHQDNSSQQPQVETDGYKDVKKSTDGKPPLFSRPAIVEPLFSKPAKKEFDCANSGGIRSFNQDKMTSRGCSNFAKTGEVICEKNRLTSRGMMLSNQNSGSHNWSPRIDVAESNTKHVISVELPGFDIKYIRVEMDDKNIIVKGKRTVGWWKSIGCSYDSFTTYHKREIQQGPCQVVWPLPPDANKDAVSAEFVEGILQITIPKL